MRGIIITAIDGTGSNDPHRRLLLDHRPDLYRRGVGAQEQVILHKEGILHVPGRVILGEVERFEIIVVELDFRPFGNQKTKPGKDIADLLNDQGNRMLGPCRRPSAGKGYIEQFAAEFFIFQPLFQRREAVLSKPSSRRVTHRIDDLADKRSLFRSERTDPLHDRGQFTLLAEELYSE